MNSIEETLATNFILAKEEIEALNNQIEVLKKHRKHLNETLSKQAHTMSDYLKAYETKSEELNEAHQTINQLQEAFKRIGIVQHIAKS